MHVGISFNGFLSGTGANSRTTVGYLGDRYQSRQRQRLTLELLMIVDALMNVIRYWGEGVAVEATREEPVGWECIDRVECKSGQARG